MNKKLTTPPDTFSDKNKWADYIELLCLSSLDKMTSMSDVYDMIYGDKSDDESEEIGMVIELKTDMSGEEAVEEIDIDIEKEEGISKGEKEDKNKSKIDDIFEFIVSRSGMFKDHYPFQVHIKSKYIRLLDKISYKQYSYLGLLISANLDYLKDYMPKLTRNFESNSLFVFKKLLPETAQVEYFGKGNERGSIFSANKLSDRIRQLSSTLKMPLSGVFDEAEVNESNSGDAGLDIVGWYNIADNISGKIIAFGQCACGSEWVNKQFDMHPAKWSNYLNHVQPILRILLTPRSFRNYQGEWFKKMKIFDCVIIDRYRFLNSLRKKENSKTAMLNMTIIDEIIKWNIDHFN